MSLRLRNLLAIVLAGGVLTLAASGQTPNVAPTATATPVAATVATPAAASAVKGAPKLETAEQIAESSIFFYGFPGYITNPIGRDRLNQIRKTTLERGTTTITSADGKREAANYQRFIIRAGSLEKERIRLDQEFPTARYSLVFNDSKIYGVFNNTVFTPRDDAAKTFENQIVRGLEALLRYKENGSTLALAPREKLMGVDYFVIDVTDKQERKTRFYVSVKTFRVMMLTYEEGGVKYKRRYYDYNYAQGTLVPYRSVLWANDKIVEETEVGTITFGQRVDEGLFASS